MKVLESCCKRGQASITIPTFFAAPDTLYLPWVNPAKVRNKPRISAERFYEKDPLGLCIYTN